MKIGIIVSQFNKKIADRLLAGAERALTENSIAKSDYSIIEVPGAFEIPFMAQQLIDTKKFDGLISLGCVIKGDTDHYKAVCDGVTYGIQKVSIENKFPVMFGVLMCSDIGLAQARSGENEKNKGYECVKGLLEIFKK